MREKREKLNKMCGATQKHNQSLRRLKLFWVIKFVSARESKWKWMFFSLYRREENMSERWILCREERKKLGSSMCTYHTKKYMYEIKQVLRKEI